MQTSFYPEKIMYYLENMPNAGSIDDLNIDNQLLYIAKVGSSDKGAQISLYIQIDNNAIIQKLKYLVYGDGYIIAALGKLSEDLPGKKLKTLANFSINKLAEDLDIPMTYIKNLSIIKQAFENILEQNKV